MHGGQVRHNGDPYFAHPIEVAGILTEYKLDTATIVAGLLHDTIEDTVATKEQIAKQFGEPVAELVDGVTKLSLLELSPDQNKQAANLQKFLLATAKDVRVLLVKLADRLHNMRTLRFIPSAEKRRQIAHETLDIYAPLARRIGMDKMSTELEERAFEEAYPEPFHAISARLARLRAERGANLTHIKSTIASKLAESGVSANLYAAKSSPIRSGANCSARACSFPTLADIYAFRVIVQTPEDCYRALGILHRTWRAVPESFEDYVSNPKPNGYRSIHTTVVGPGNVRVEIQIRTEEMDRIAELGIAAHWRYKNEAYGFDAEQSKSKGLDARAAVQSLLDIADHGGDAEEYLEHTKLDMYQDHVFAFTPKGKLIALPQGASPLDFAYAVHSDIGDRAIGARIGGEERPLRTVLRNGDVVDILTSDHAAPVPGWASITRTGRARSAQRRLERIVRRDEFERLGRELTAQALEHLGRDLASTSLAKRRASLVSIMKLRCFAGVGEGQVRANMVAATAFPGLHEKLKIAQDAREPIEERKARLYVQGGHLTPGMALHFAECCSPVPGDRIVGVQTKGQGVTIHTIDCERLAEFDEESADWIDLAWTDEAREHALGVGRIVAVVENARGALAQLCKIIADHEGNILDVRIKRNAKSFFDMRFDIEVADVKHLANILAAMRTSKAVREVERVRT